MLSVGRREDGTRGLGFGGGGMEEEEEENELEEGEACSGQEDDSCIDPDALSYIDDKIQDVLGHFQKDFEAGVSAENLGAKFGGYGSFLPTHQRSPSILCQPKSPQKAPNQNVTGSPYNAPVEVTNQNASVTMSSSFPKNNTVVMPLLDNSCNTGVSMNKQKIQNSSSQHTSFNKTTNGTHHKPLKVRIKVGPDNNMARNNAAIYSGLGLVMSPSSSFEDSPDGSGGISPEFQDLPDESPNTIIQVMTCFAVPGGVLLSPLQHSLFQLMEKDLSFIKHSKRGKFYKGKPETTTDITIHPREVKGQIEKQMKPGEQKPWEMKNWEVKDDVILSREVDIETHAGQELASNSFNMPPSSISKNVVKKGQVVGNTVKIDADLLDHPSEMKALSKDKSSSTGLVKDKHFEFVEGRTNNGVCNTGNVVMHSRGQLNSKVSMAEKAFEEQRDQNSGLQREGRIKVEKDSVITNTHSSGHKRRNEQVAETADYVRPSSSPYREKILQGKDEMSDRKKKLRVSQTNSESLREFSKDNVSCNSSATLKEKKKTSRAKADHAEKKSKVVKSHKDLSGACIRESHGNVNWDVGAEQLENGVGPWNHSKGKQKAIKHKHEKGPVISSQIFKEISGGKKVENAPTSGAFVSESTLAPLTCNAPTTDATFAPQAPVVIEEHWVCCDLCQKWRLLPYGTNPGHLPTKWQCSLLNWLPGMNSCNISEEETTNALHALYLAPSLENGASLDGCNVAASSASLANAAHGGQNLELNIQNEPTVGKKKSAPKNASNAPSHSTPFPNSVKRVEQAYVKCRSSNDANHYIPSEINTSNKDSLDFSAGMQKPKQKEKHKKHGCYSDGGDNSGRIEKHSKPKSNREVDQDDLRTSKKLKKASLQYPKTDCSNHNVASKDFEEPDIDGYSTKVITDNQPRWNNFPLSKDPKSDVKGTSSALSKKLRDEGLFITNGESREHFGTSDVEKSSNLDLSAEKRKVKEWQESQRNKEALVTSRKVVENGVSGNGALGETEPAKDKKAELSTLSEGKRHKTAKLNSRMDKKGTMTRMTLPSNGEHLRMDEEFYVVEKGHRPSQSQGNAASLRELDFDSFKRDAAYAQHPVAANSSSSKVSGSHKSRSNLQETKDSPVESVSSSPLRIPSIEKLSCKRVSELKDDAAIVDSSVLGSPKRCSDSEVNGGNGNFGKCKKERAFSIQQRSLEGQRAVDSGILDSLGGTFDYVEKERSQLSVGKSEGRLHVKSAHDDIPPTELGGRPCKDGIQDLDKMNGHRLMTDSIQRKSGKSSSGFKEKYRGSKSDLEKSKLKVSGSYIENKDLHSANNGSSCKLESTFGSCENGKDNFHEKDCLGKNDSTSKWMTSRQDNGSTLVMQENMDDNGPSMLSNQHRDSNSKIPVVGTRCVKPEFQVAPTSHNEKALNHHCSDKIVFPELPSGLGKSQVKLASGDKQQTQSGDPHLVSSPLKASRTDVELADGVNADVSKMIKQHRQPDLLNGLHHNNLRHATPNGLDTSSPIRKENHAALVKEARDLKHTANRLKNEGLELESTGLYFEAALKFLHVAALMESVNVDTAKQAEAAQMFFETAKLCEFVAREYEKVKDMAAAALAYKCIEVAHLKAAFCKNPYASKDRHELQAAFQFLPPGESPSSSASDVDNLNNQVILGKNASAKAVSSPQVAGNHVIAARHHHQVMRLLHYTNDLICAFEATRKAQICIAAASVSLEKDKVDSVRKVLDFNFHNVEGLLRLVRLSLESIGR